MTVEDMMIHRLRRPTVIAMRVTVVLGFLVIMPILAIPAVLSAVDELWGEASGFVLAVMQGSSGEMAEPPRRATFHQAVATIDVSEETVEAIGDGTGERIELAAAESGDLRGPTRPDPIEQVKRLPPVRAEQRMEEICRDLQRFGATRLHLERIGSHEQSYHFRCVMPVPDTGIYELPFSATDPDPVRAMERVLAKIEGWSTAADRVTSVRRAPRR